MSQNKKILHDISKIASTAFSCASSMKKDATSYMKKSLSNFFSKMNLVKRDEFEAQNKILMQTKKRVDEIIDDTKTDVKSIKGSIKGKEIVKKSVSTVKKTDKTKPTKSSKSSPKKIEVAGTKSEKSVKKPVKRTSKK